MIESILQASGGFNPETAFPRGCFPRAWPFVGDELPPPPPRPPTRQLVVEQVGERLEIVWRGEIPITFPAARTQGTPPSRWRPITPSRFRRHSARGDPARDPP